MTLYRSRIWGWCLALCLGIVAPIGAQTVDLHHQDGFVYFQVTEAQARNLPEFRLAAPHAEPLPEDAAEQRLFLSAHGHTAPMGWDQTHWQWLQPLVNDFGIWEMKNAAILQDPLLLRWYQIRFTDMYRIGELIESLRALPFITWAEPKPITYTSNTFRPNDYVPQGTSGSLHLDQVNAGGAWAYSRGDRSTVIAVVDDAVRINHEDLAPAIWVNTGEIPNNGIDDDNNGFVDDVNGWDFSGVDLSSGDNNPNPPSNANNNLFSHGTHTGGIAAATTDNGRGIASLAFEAQLMPIKATPDTASGLQIFDGYEGIQYAAANGAHVVNCSWGGPAFANFQRDVVSTAIARGTVVVAAAGNEGANTRIYPCGFNNVLCVGATDPFNANRIANYSNYGNWISVLAPGAIYSTLAGSTTSYGVNIGTSMSSPLVASLAGLIRSFRPGIQVQEINNCIKNSAVNLDGFNANRAGQMGSGRIQATNALACARGSACEPTLITTHLTGNQTDTLILDGTGYWAGTGDNARAKAQFFEGYTGYNLVSGLEAWFGYAASPNSGATLEFVLWNGDNRERAPQAELATASVSLSSIQADIAAGRATLVNFNTPIEVQGWYSLGIRWTAGDSVALRSSLPGETTGNAVAWEQRSTGTWATVGSRTGQDISLAIFPRMVTPESNLSITFNLPDTIYAGTATSLSASAQGAERYVWIIGAFSSQGSTISFTFPNAGTFNVVVNASRGNCFTLDTVQVTVLPAPSAVGDALNQPAISLGPNPGTDYLRLSSSSLAQDATVTVTDLTGRTVLQSRLPASGSNFAHEIETKHLAPGLYPVRIQSGAAVWQFRWLKAE